MHPCSESTAQRDLRDEYPDDDEIVARQISGEDRRVEAMVLSRDVIVDAWLEGKF